MNNELRKGLLISMDQISINMPNIIFNHYFDKFGNDKKYILSMMEDAFKTVDVFCYASRNVAISQAGSLLRQLLEQVSIVCLLVDNPDLLNDYIEHFKFRQINNYLAKKELIKAISEHYSIGNNRFALVYLDYGWIKCKEGRNCSEDEMIRMAGFEDILSWRKTFLDKLVHASYTTTNCLIDGDFPMIDKLIEIAAKLFDHLCISFHKLTGFDFVFKGIDLFHSEFRKEYQILIDNDNKNKS